MARAVQNLAVQNREQVGGGETPLSSLLRLPHRQLLTSEYGDVLSREKVARQAMGPIKPATVTNRLFAATPRMICKLAWTT